MDGVTDPVRTRGSCRTWIWGFATGQNGEASLMRLELESDSFCFLTPHTNLWLCTACVYVLSHHAVLCCSRQTAGNLDSVLFLVSVVVLLGFKRALCGAQSVLCYARALGSFKCLNTICFNWCALLNNCPCWWQSQIEGDGKSVVGKEIAALEAHFSVWIPQSVIFCLYCKCLAYAERYGI